MKKAIAIIILGLLVGGCADSSGVRPFGPKPLDVGRVLEFNEHYILIVYDRSVISLESGPIGSKQDDGRLNLPQRKAKEHCGKYKKFANFYGWDFDNRGAYYRCHSDFTEKNDSGNKIQWTTYPDKFWEVKKKSKKTAKKKEEPITVAEKPEPFLLRYILGCSL